MVDSLIGAIHIPRVGQTPNGNGSGRMESSIGVVIRAAAIDCYLGS